MQVRIDNETRARLETISVLFGVTQRDVADASLRSRLGLPAVAYQRSQWVKSPDSVAFGPVYPVRNPTVALTPDVVATVDPDRRPGQRGRGRCSATVVEAVALLYRAGVPSDRAWCDLTPGERGVAMETWRETITVEEAE